MRGPNAQVETGEGEVVAEAAPGPPAISTPPAAVTLSAPCPPTPSPQHPFDTYAMTAALQAAGLASAKPLVDTIRLLITTRSGRARTTMLSTNERDNVGHEETLTQDAYHFKAALSILRAEQSARASKDGMTMRAGTAALRRQVVALDQQMREDVALMRHEWVDCGTLTQCRYGDGLEQGGHARGNEAVRDGRAGDQQQVYDFVVRSEDGD